MGEHKLQLGKEPRVRGVSRVHDHNIVGHEKYLMILFDRRVTDDELKAFHDFLRDVNAVIEEHDRKRTPEERANHAGL